MGWRLDAAETLWKQGDHDGAWLALELEPIERVMRQAIDRCLRILNSLRHWELGAAQDLRAPGRHWSHHG